MCTEQETSRAIELYSDMIRRICLLHLKNHADTEDVFQEVFLKYVLRGAVFESVEHERAWLIRVTVNACKAVSYTHLWAARFGLLTLPVI